jgi:hypothetical protein
LQNKLRNISPNISDGVIEAIGITHMKKEDLKFAWIEDIGIVVNMFSAVIEDAFSRTESMKRDKRSKMKKTRKLHVFRFLEAVFVFCCFCFPIGRLERAIRSDFVVVGFFIFLKDI